MSGRRRYFRLPASEQTIARDIDDEIAFHLEQRVAALRGAGISEDDARRQAEREFGDMRQARAELSAIDRVTLQRERRGRWWDALWYDMRLAVRGMRRNVAFTVAVVVTFGLGIGVNAVTFGIADRLLLSAPPHVAAPDGVVRVLYRHTGSGGEATVAAMFPYADYTVVHETGSFRDIAAYTPAQPTVLDRGESATEIRVVFTTASFFPTLGVRPALGRFYNETEDTPPRGERLAVLSDALWRNRFGADADVIGRVIELDHESYEVIGVAPRGFTGIELEPVDAWVPVSAIGADRGGAEWHTWRGMHWLRLVARLHEPAASAAVRAQASAAFVAANGERFEGDSTAALLFGSVIAARAPAVDEGTPQRSGRIALWLLGVSVLVLLVACANVANLLLARGIRQRREIGVRLAIGVGRSRIVRHVLTETLLFAALGTGFALLLAHWGGQLARALLLPDLAWTEQPIDVRVFGFAMCAAIVSAMLAGLLPALQAARADASSLLALGGRASLRRSRARSVLLVVQAALSVLLLIGAGLFVRSLRELSNIQLGFEPHRVAAFSWHDNGLDWEPSRTTALYDAGLERVRAVRGIEAAALSMTAPMAGRIYGYIRVPGLDSLPDRVRNELYYAPVSTDYFRTIGARIVRGRAFTETDVQGSPAVTIVTEDLAELLWPREDAIGKCIIHLAGAEDTCARVVGIVERTRYDAVLSEGSAMYFVPLAQMTRRRALRTLLVRPAPGEDDAIEAARAALQTLEPGLPLVRMYWLEELVAPQLQPWRLGAAFFSGFGVLALLLAALGLYALVAYDVAQRRRELGVRHALGARAAALIRVVLTDAVRLVAAGLFIGLIIAVATARFIEPLLYSVSPRDPLVFLVVAATLFAVAVVAAGVPAWRAAGTQPTDALRDE